MLSAGAGRGSVVAVGGDDFVDLTGLTKAQAKELLEKIGPNELRPEPSRGILLRFAEQLKQVLVIMLLAAAIISAAAGEWLDFAAILAIVVINAAIGVLQEYRAEKALQALKRLAAPVARVLRDGAWTAVPARDLVPGDVVSLEAGDRVPADLILLESANLRVDESILTGESVPVEKMPAAGSRAGGDSALYATTTVVYGRGKGRVDLTGMDTRVGRLAATLSSAPDEEPPLKRKLEQMGKNLGIAAVVLIGLTFVAGILRGEPSLEMLLAAVSLGVAAIPEGLPAIVTIVLAIGTQRMSARRAIVRRLAAVETLGSVTVICTDKTGTLTRNEMSVTELLAGGRKYVVTGGGYDPLGEVIPVDVDGIPMPPAPLTAPRGASGPDGLRGPLEALLAGGVLASDAELQQGESGWEIVGDPTEGALVVVAAKAGLGRESLAPVYPRVDEIPFDSARKMMSTIHRYAPADGQASHVTLTKGAPSIVLERCSHAWMDGGVVPLTAEVRSQIAAASQDMAQRALRVLALGYHRFDHRPEPAGEVIEEGLTFVGLWGMIDPPRPESRKAVEDCRAACVRPVMITGDQAPTAMAIAHSVGIATGGMPPVSGAEIDRSSDDRLAEMVKRSSVFAEVSPEHKSRIVHALKRGGEVVAMTGDGVNDAPALKWADIGISMGLKGTDVAKEASDLILADDNFATIVAAVEEGRIVYSNIVKAIRYLLSCNSGELVTVTGAILAGLGSPLSPIQILWVNLVTDAGPAIALGMDRSEAGVLRFSRPNPRDNLLSAGMTVRLLAEGLLIGGLGLGGYWFALARGGRDYARTVCFLVLALSQMFHAQNCRSPRRSLLGMGLFRSRPVNLALLASLVLQGLAVFSPLRRAFGAVPLAAGDLAVVVLAAASVIPLGELLKAALRRRTASA
ncbi:MAG: cation-translocating P-type ATPase [Firmicutes bacterium]|nr:cation-translocating P-type ATPase [Bacillota bacterium]